MVNFVLFKILAFSVLNSFTRDCVAIILQHILIAGCFIAFSYLNVMAPASLPHHLQELSGTLMVGHRE